MTSGLTPTRGEGRADEGNQALRPDSFPASLGIAVIGHQGRMGAMLMAHWQAAGHSVRGADRPLRAFSAHDPRSGAGFLEEDSSLRHSNRAGGGLKEGAEAAMRQKKDGYKTEDGASANAIPRAVMQEAAQGADVVALCVPAMAMEAVLEDLAPLLSPGQLLCDITSVKVLPMRLMERHFAGPVVGAHPLFGPEHKPEDLHVALTPGKNAGADHVRLIGALFEGFGCTTFVTSPEEHDRSVAFVQGLNFVSSAAYFASLAHRKELLPFLTPSFRRRLEGARKLLTEDAGMFQGFTSANPMTGDAIHTFRLFLDLVERGGLADVARQARWWYDKDEDDS